MFTSQDEYWLQQAIKLAKYAISIGEVPVGAVLVQQDKIVANGFNCPIASHDPTAHAEVMALRAGASKLSNYRLVDTTLYVTLEPCMMCAGAIVHARVNRVVFGAYDPKAGVISSNMHIFDQPFLNHQVSYSGGLLADECCELMRSFFKERRLKTNAK